MRIVMIGTGYVGLVSGACFADFGHHVTCVDKNTAKIDALKRGEISIFEPDLDRVATGKKKSAEVLCTMCHLGEFAGQNEVPRVAGQHPEYVVRQLRDYRSRARTNDAGTMTAVARTLSDEDIENLAHYLASL